MGKIKVAVIFGGTSSEHEISRLSAFNIIQNIPKDKYEVIMIGITKKGRWFYFPGDTNLILNGQWEHSQDCVPAILSPDALHHGILKLEGQEWSLQKIDVVFPALHGKFGEDGTIQGLLDMAAIPYVGSGVLSSAICMDKHFTHQILELHGIKMAKWHVIDRSKIDSDFESFCTTCEHDLLYPMFVKPACGGSTIGISKAKNRQELESAIKLAFAHHHKVLVEETIIGRELECAVLNGVPSLPGEIKPTVEFYDFDAKYSSSSTTTYDIPAPVPQDVTTSIQQIAAKAFEVLQCATLLRVDFFYTQNNQLLINEVNTIPGFTEISMYSKLINLSGTPYPQLLDTLLSTTLELI